MEEKKKERKKISLATYVISLIIMFIIAAVLIAIILKQNADLNESNKSNQEQEDANQTQNSEIANIPSTEEYTWEEYPEDMDKQILYDVYGAGDYDMEKLIADYQGSTSYTLKTKTYYSLMKNNTNAEDFVIIEYGDSAGWKEWTSNYAKYCYPDNENNDLSTKYTKTITYSTAIVNEQYYDGYYDLETAVKYHAEKLQADNPDEEYYYKANQIVIMNGNNESEEEYKNNARAKTIKVTVNNDKVYTFDLKDTNVAQIFDLDYTQNSIEKPIDIEIEVIDTYSGEKTNDVYISDVQVSMDSNIPQGR